MYDGIIAAGEITIMFMVSLFCRLVILSRSGDGIGEGKLAECFHQKFHNMVVYEYDMSGDGE